MWVRISVAIEQNEHRADLVTISRRQELLNAPKKSLGIPFPGKVMEKHPDAVEAQPPAQPSPRSMGGKSKEAACHISSWLDCRTGQEVTTD